MTVVTKDLGLVQAMHSGATAPTNTVLMWYDTNVNLHKYYDVGSSTWVTFTAAAAALSQVLTAGPSTGGNDIIITSGDKISYAIGGFFGDLEPASLTGNRTWQLPDSSGVLALLSDISAIDLATVLSSGIISGPYNISMDDSQYIKATNGGGRLNLRDGANGVTSLLSDGTTTNAYLTLRASGASELKSQSGLFMLLGNEFSLYSGATEKFSVSQSSDHIYLFNTTTAKKIFVGIDVATLLEIETAGVVVSAGKKLSVGSGALGTAVLHVGYTGGAGSGSVAIDKASGVAAFFRFENVGVNAFELLLDATENMYITNKTTDKNTFFRGYPGGVLTSIMTFNGTDGHIYAHQNLHLDQELIIKVASIAAATTINSIRFSNIRLTGGGAVDLSEITGYATDKVLFLRNEGAGTVTLKHDNIVSSGKLYLAGDADIPLLTGEGITLIYSSSLGAWIGLEN